VRLVDRLLHTLTEGGQCALLGLETVPQLVQLRLEGQYAVLNAGLELADGVYRAFHLLRGLLPGAFNVHAVHPRVRRCIAKARSAQHALGALAIHYVLLAMARTPTLSVLGAFAHMHHLMSGEHFCTMSMFSAVSAKRLSCKYVQYISFYILDNLILILKDISLINIPHVVQKNIVDLSRLSQLAHGGFSEFASSTNWRIS